MINPLVRNVVDRVAAGNVHPVLVDGGSGRRPTPAEFWADTRSVAARLAERGVGLGDPVAVTMAADETFVQVLYACLTLGAVPAFLDPGAAPEVVGRTVATLRPKAWVTGRPISGFDTVLADELNPRLVGIHSGADSIVPVEVDDRHPVFLVYTSGTTGMPKAVPWNVSNIRSYLAVQNRLYGHLDIRVEFAFLPFLGMMDLGLGRCIVLPALSDPQPALTDIAEVVTQLNRYGCDYAFASPTLWRRIVDHSREHGLDLPAVKVATTSGAAVNPRLLHALSEALPGARIDVHYASTEAPMPIAVIDAGRLTDLIGTESSHGRGVPIGYPVDTRVAVVDPDAGGLRDITDADLLPPGQPGELVVSGPRVTEHYYRNPELTELAKLHHKDGTVWHRMGDLGYLDADGLVWFLCRRKHVFTTASGRVHPDQQESVYNHYLGSYQCALVPVTGRPGPALVLPEAEPAGIDQPAVTAVATRFGYPVPLLLRHPGRLPSDRRHNSKIDREALAAWAADRPGADS